MTKNGIVYNVAFEHTPSAHKSCPIFWVILLIHVALDGCRAKCRVLFTEFSIVFSSVFQGSAPPVGTTFGGNPRIKERPCQGVVVPGRFAILQPASDELMRADRAIGRAAQAIPSRVMLIDGVAVFRRSCARTGLNDHVSQLRRIGQAEKQGCLCILVG